MLKLPKQYHPDFAQRNRKPIGDVAADRNNPFGRHAKSCLLFRNDLTDAITGERYTDNGNLPHTFTRNNIWVTGGGGGSGGIYWKAGGASDPLAGKDWSFIFHLRPDTLSGFRALIDTLNGSDDPFLGFSGTSAVFYLAGTGGTLSTGTWYTVVYTYDSSADVGSVYVDGVQVASGTHTGSMSGSDIYIFKAGGDNPFDGECEMFAYFEKCFTPGEAMDITLDRYQFLRPAQPALYFTPAGAPGSYTLVADAGSFSITGEAANLEHHRSLTAEAGSLDITGFDATLTYTQPGVYTLTADAGSFVITGSPATLTYNGAGNWTTQNPTASTWAEQSATAASWDKQNPT